MEYEYGSEYDKDRGLVFCIPEDTIYRDKYIKDFFYWKTWGDDRNRFILKQTNKYDELQNEGFKVFSSIKPQSLYFSILLLDIPYEKLFDTDTYIHSQTNSMGSLWQDMDTRYEHDNKPLVLVNYDIKVDNIKRVIGTGQSIVTKENKINTILQI